jgi:alginate O-acetyltransferase complex protein AlgI
MLFCSQQFLLFFLVVFGLYWSMSWQRGRLYLLLIASFVFYATWNEWLAVLIVVTTTADYFIARGLDACSRPRLRRALLSASILFNIGILCYFKYANFFLRSLEDALKGTGAATSLPVLSVVLPIGISFYTFEAISYTVDVYRRKIRAERNLGHFMLFILFFPHLIAGPIVRGSDFLPQIRRKKRWNWLRINVGARLFVLGMVKKLAIADRLALLTDPVFADPGSYERLVLWVAAVAYAVQVYCDFSGYSDMAMGTAQLLGYRLALNFNLPFLARNIADFWRRWHITLSSWLRDYVFIPLGGSRSGELVFRNLFITMILCGLWHGASWNFILFGVIQAVCLSLYRVFRKWAKERPTVCQIMESRPGTIGCVALTFLTFCTTLVVFRAQSLGQSWIMLQRMFVPDGIGAAAPVSLFMIACLMALVAIGYWIARNERWRGLMDAVPATMLGVGYSLAITFALVMTPQAGKTFIYFQF